MRAWRVLKRTVVKFYDDQMTQHAAAMTYYALMSLFPVLLLGISMLGLLGQYPGTYNAIVSYLRDVVPATTLNAIDSSLRGAIRHKGNATTALVIGVAFAFYGTTGVLEAARRALNVVFEIDQGRGFFRRKGRDIASSFILIGLVLITIMLVFVGGELARHVFGGEGSRFWNFIRWPLSVIVAMVAFAYVYYVTPDLTKTERRFHLMTPGAVTAVVAWLLISFGFSQYLSNYNNLNAIYGAFTGAIILVTYLWLTNVALLFGAELNAVLTREITARATAPDVAPEPQLSGTDAPSVR